MKLLTNSLASTITPLWLGMDTYFHPTLYWACEYLSILVLKLSHISKRDPD